MVIRQIMIKIPEAVKPYPLSLLTQIANRFECDVILETDNKKINMKKFSQIRTVELNTGSEIIIYAHGRDEIEAMEAVQGFFIYNYHSGIKKAVAI